MSAENQELETQNQLKSEEITKARNEHNLKVNEFNNIINQKSTLIKEAETRKRTIKNELNIAKDDEKIAQNKLEALQAKFQKDLTDLKAKKTKTLNILKEEQDAEIVGMTWKIKAKNQDILRLQNELKEVQSQQTNLDEAHKSKVDQLKSEI